MEKSVYGRVDLIVSGGVIPEWSYDIHRSITASYGDKYQIRFNVGYKLGRDTSRLNIRVVFSDGSEILRQCEVVTDDATILKYHVATEIIATTDNTGVIYAELLHDDVPIAGIVFSTAGPTECGEWRYDSDLLPMTPYSYSAAVERLRDSLHIYELPDSNPRCGNL